MRVGFILSNYDKDLLLKCHREILDFYPFPHEIIVVHSGTKPLVCPGQEIIYLPSFGFRLGPFVALLKGIEEAGRRGLQAVCFRPGDDWVFNHERVAENFNRLGQIKFQATNWFTNNSYSDWSLNESYYHVPRFTPHLEWAWEAATLRDRYRNCEQNLAVWVEQVLDRSEVYHLLGRERFPPIAWVKEEIPLGFERHGQTMPPNYVYDTDNTRFSNRAWQLIGDHDDQDRRSNYQRFRQEILYADELERKPYFSRWLAGDVS